MHRHDVGGENGFRFRLKAEEKTELVTNCDRFFRWKHSTVFPFAFTEHGAIMAASVLNSPRAIEASVYVVRAFVKMREVLTSHKGLVRRLDEMEATYDRQFKVVFDAIRGLMQPPRKAVRKFSFVGIGNSGRRDVAEEHERLLWKK